MHVKINTAALQDYEAPIQNADAEAVRMGFNPSKMPRVDAIKALSAALMSECRAAGEEQGDDRSATLAVTNVEQAAMWGVKAATAGL